MVRHIKIALLIGVIVLCSIMLNACSTIESSEPEVLKSECGSLAPEEPVKCSCAVAPCTLLSCDIYFDSRTDAPQHDVNLITQAMCDYTSSKYLTMEELKNIPSGTMICVDTIDKTLLGYKDDKYMQCARKV